MLRLFKRKPCVPAPRWSLDTPLLQLGGLPWTLRDAYESTMVMGSTGAGKSSSSIAQLLAALARTGGGLCLTVKREDAASYRDAVIKAGRATDLIVFSPVENPLRFNFMAEEIAQCPDAQGAAENVTALIMLVIEIADRTRRTRGGSSENAEYFRQAMLRLCRFAVFVLLFSGEDVTVSNLHRLVISSPRSRAEACDTAFQQRSFMFACLQAAAAVPKNPSLHADCELAIAFFMEEWADLNQRTRSTVESTLTAATDALSRGVVRDTLCSPSPNFSPVMLCEGKIVVLDYPVLVHREVAQVVQVVMKACVQRYLSRRQTGLDRRPVFMLMDECQHLIVSEDEQFATTSRSTGCAMIWATQSASTLLEAFGGGGAEPRMQSFLGNCGTQIHHQQTDTRTIKYLQELTGQSRQLLVNGGQSGQDDWMATLFGGTSRSLSAGFSETWQHQIHADDLNGLRKGGPPHYYAEAIVYRGGRRLSSGRTWARVAVPQSR